MLNMNGLIHRKTILPVVLIVLLTHGTLPVAAATASASSNQLQLVKLAAVPPDPNAPPGSIKFQAQVNYTLDASPSGFLALFAFEDNSQRSSQHSSDPIAINAGAGQTNLDIQYVPVHQVKTLTLVAGLFNQDQRLLGWVSTNPMPLASWTARIQFQEAMASRLDRNYAAAVDRLTQAIQASPDTGNLYYWRADSRVRLGQYDDAIHDYGKALELMPEHRASMLGRGVAWLWENQLDPAVKDLTAAIDSSSDPDSVTAWAHRARGIANAALGRPAEAIADYEAYLSMSPQASDSAEVQGWIDQLQPLVTSNQSGQTGQ